MSFASAAAKLWHVISEDPPPFDPHPGFTCDTMGPRCRCSICTGIYVDDDGGEHRMDESERTDG